MTNCYSRIKPVLAASLAASLAACGSSLSSSSGSSGNVTTAYACNASPVSSGPALIVSGFGDNSLSRYHINSDGTLQTIDCAPYSAAPGISQPTGLASDSTGSLLFAANYSSNSVASFQWNGTTMSLTPAAGSPFAAGVTPWAVTTDANGRFLYVANGGGGGPNSISGYTINNANGTLTPIAGLSADPNGQAFALAVDPSSAYLFAANYTSPDSVSAYAINGTTGNLTLVGEYAAGGADPRSVVVDPSGHYVYVANTNRIGDQVGAACNGGSPAGTTITGFSIGAGGALTPVGAPFSTDLAPQALAVASVGGSEYLYSANYCADDITVFQIGAGGALTLLGRAQEPAQSGPHGMFVYNSQDLYVVNYLSNSITAYQIGGNGLLTSLATYAAGDNPSSVTGSP